jgi:bifunctional non-homologous end joining protein LigD
MDSLETYRAKRDFKRTSEPAGSSRRSGGKRSPGGVFVIHKHAARRLHYDLRLEHDGVLWSWAVTRGPSLDPSEKRLAVHVEDHPLDYGSFEGTIPEGEYGAGAVIVWDEGVWTPDGDPAAAMKKGHIRFKLEGRKLNGAWHLVRLKRREREKRDNWLLIKSDDSFARPGEDLLAEAPESVKSGRTIEDVEAGRAASVKTRTAAARVRSGRTKPSVRMPDFISPALATLRSTPPSGDDWLHEVKFDGYRIEAHVDGGKVRLFTRSGLDWSGRFGMRIVEALASLDCSQAIIDGEVVVLGDDGLSSFSALQAALSSNRTERMFLYAFDLLHLDGEDLRQQPLVERKHRLAELLSEGAGEGNSPLRFSEHFAEPGATMLSHACRMGLEGVVSKRADAPYVSGRTLSWIKSKCTERQEFVIVGYLPSAAAGRGVRSLVLAYHDKGKLTYAGHVGTGFSQGNAAGLKERLDRLKRPKPAFEGRGSREKNAIWVEPQLVADVEFRAWTSDGILRHASFQGLREDKPAEEVVAETAAPAETADRAKRVRTPASKAKAPKAARTSVTLSNADKLLWPEAGVSKKDMLDHYELVWPRMEQFVVNRPLALVRAPDGIGGQRFFQKHASKGMHEAIRRFADPEDGEELLYIEDFDGLAALVQLGVVEIHIWGSTLGAIDTPDQIVFDLDPDEGLGIEHVRTATLDVRGRLEEIGLSTFVKTSGGKGFHVVVPLEPKADWAGVKGFAHDFARAMEEAEPERYTATLSKKARKGRIFLDYLRNGRGSTTVAPWSTRAKAAASVSVPVTFDLVSGGTGPADYTVGSKALKAMLRKPDPWTEFFGKGKPLDR